MAEDPYPYYDWFRSLNSDPLIQILKKKQYNWGLADITSEQSFKLGDL